MTGPLASGRLQTLAAWRLRLPLKEPYLNALGPLADFDAIVFRLGAPGGRSGWGEACPVAGYSPETPDEAWDFARGAVEALAGGSIPEVLAYAREHQAHFPFVASALNEAAACLSGDPLLAPVDAPVAVELAGTVNSLSTEDACRRAVALCDAGYRTLKVKVGYEAGRDAARVNAIAAAVGDRARLRVDANQGYDVESALRFARAARPDAIEVFEQPLRADAWPQLAQVAAGSPLPLMLDESIYGIDDIRRAAQEVGARAVKLKMSKTGGPAGLREQVDVARRYGLGVVIGNGVASDLGCLHEALCFARLGLDRAAEFNGFLKLRSPLLPAGLRFEAPCLRLDPGVPAEPSRAALETFALDRIER